ncbi:MAG: hypothetical protein O8C67_07000 [Candidatus Methanoperedens sp.]|nr:hypothetical protein [Candidatus Methanoperedens sp.]
MSMPSMMTFPAVGLTRVDSILMSVVFPAPFGPNIVRNSPFSILRLIFRRTMLVPNAFERFSIEIIWISPSFL